jgi:hypothetical protein
LDFQFFILAILWLGGANYVVMLSLKRQDLPLTYMLTPVVLKYLKAKDWLRILLLAILTLGIVSILPA